MKAKEIFLTGNIFSAIVSQPRPATILREKHVFFSWSEIISQLKSKPILFPWRVLNSYLRLLLYSHSQFPSHRRRKKIVIIFFLHARKCTRFSSPLHTIWIIELQQKRGGTRHWMHFISDQLINHSETAIMQRVDVCRHGLDEVRARQ